LRRLLEGAESHRAIVNFDASPKELPLHQGVRTQAQGGSDSIPAAPNSVGVSGPRRAAKMTLGTILLVILILILVGAIPSWGYNRSWGYGPSGIVGVLLIVVIILLLTGRI
jgi:hypothetical protein